MKSLTEVLEGIAKTALNEQITGVTADSREVRPGSLFVAVRGTSIDGHRFAAEAAGRGAALILAEKDLPLQEPPVLIVPDTRKALARAAANFHGNPSRELLVVGITGTSGKTTTSYLVESILRSAGHKVGVIGTISIRYPGHEVEASQTTPGPVELHGLLARMKAAGCTAVVMEVSSHALSQDRVGAVAFDAVIFTNLSPEHQDYHPDMEHYFLAKARLFTEHMKFSQESHKNPVVIVNEDDPYGRRLIAGSFVPCFPFSLGNSLSEWTIGVEGIQGVSRGLPVASPFIGRFNAENILGALTVAEALRVTPQAAAGGIRECGSIPGRLERVNNTKGIHVFVDYAHKPDALEKVLVTLKEALQNSDARLITVFGCGGDRDRAKRPVMGRLAALHSSQVWVTSDNPRTEDPDRIIQEIVSGVPDALRGPVTIQPDRRLAIQEALQGARQGDLVLIAGKGHESYQILPDPAAPGKTRKTPFDDRLVATAALS